MSDFGKRLEAAALELWDGRDLDEAVTLDDFVHLVRAANAAQPDSAPLRNRASASSHRE